MKHYEQLARYRKALELNPSLEAARDNLKLLDATPERTRFHRQPKPTNFKGSEPVVASILTNAGALANWWCGTQEQTDEIGLL